MPRSTYWRQPNGQLGGWKRLGCVIPRFNGYASIGSTENQTSEIRWDYNNVSFGTCQETIEGGNHFRYWIQDGPDADSGAIFLAVSYELPVAGEQHQFTLLWCN